MEFSKATIIKWEGKVDQDLYWLYDEFRIARELFAGKTDFQQTKVDDTTVRRVWVDEESAQAWIDFTQEIATRTSTPIVSATIVDNS